MTGFLLFAGDRYYPSGGWGDFIGAFDTQEEALERLVSVNLEYSNWWHVVDASIMQVVSEGKRK